jgi:hypothetical protein
MHQSQQTTGTDRPSSGLVWCFFGLIGSLEIQSDLFGAVRRLEGPMNHDTHPLSMHGRARIRPIPAHRSAGLSPADQHRTHCGATRAGGEHALPHLGTQDARAILDDVWAVPPHQPKRGSDAPASTIELRMRSRATKRGGLWAYVGVSVVASCAHRHICCLRSFAASGCRRHGRSRRYTYADYDRRLGVG